MGPAGRAGGPLCHQGGQSRFGHVLGRQPHYGDARRARAGYGEHARDRGGIAGPRGIGIAFIDDRKDAGPACGTARCLGPAGRWGQRFAVGASERGGPTGPGRSRGQAQGTGE